MGKWAQVIGRIWAELRNMAYTRAQNYSTPVSSFWIKFRLVMRHALLMLVALFCLPFFQSKGDETSQLPKTILLDNFYRHQTPSSKGHHYTWNETGPSGFSQLGAMFVSRGAHIETLETAPTKEILDHCSVYIIIDPNTASNADNHAPNYMDAKAADVIVDWVKAGGSLMLMNNDKNNAEFEHFNILANRFGISFNQDVRNAAPHHEPDQMQLKTSAFSAHPILHDVALISLRLICTLSVQSPAQAILTAPKESGSGTDVIMATSSLGKGKIFAIGDPWLYNEYLHAVDNGKAAENLVPWLLGEVK